MISIIITSFNEPKTIGKAIESFLNQDLPKDYELIVAAPDKPTHEIVKSYSKKNKKVKLFIDPGKGKSYALNLLLKDVKGDIIILTDGDVFVSKNSLNQILEPFKDKNVGCVTGRPVSIESRDNMFGYWSHLLCDAAHELRLQRKKKSQFLECSGYYWAFRNGVIKKFPLDLAEDTVVPLLFREKSYKIDYVPKAEVYVKFPTNLHDFVEQKKRTAKGHESLSKYVDMRKLPRMKTFKTELAGIFFVLSYPRNLKEFFWTFVLLPTRLYIWVLVFYHMYVKKEHYKDAWKRVESTK